MKKQQRRNKHLKFHIKEWDYKPREIQNNFHNDVREYISWLVKAYIGLARVQ